MTRASEPDTNTPDSESLLRSRLAPIGVGIAGLAASVIAYAVEPTRTAWLPKCPFHLLTGLYCPGCGATRALHDLTNGDPIGALHNNALFITMLPLVLFAWFRWFRFAGSSPLTLSSRTGTVLVAFVAAFAVARNIPQLHVLTPIG